MIDTERHEFLERLISDAVSAGARILARKEIPEGLGKNFFAPVILERRPRVVFETKPRHLREELAFLRGLLSGRAAARP